MVITYAPLRQCSAYPHIGDEEVRHREGPEVPEWQGLGFTPYLLTADRVPALEHHFILHFYCLESQRTLGVFLLFFLL